MNLNKTEKIGISRRGIIIYSTIIFICIIALLVGFYVQFYKRIDLTKLVGLNHNEKFANKSEEKIIEFESSFFKLFNNMIYNKDNINYNKKLENDKEVVYTIYDKKETKTNSYDLEVHLPKINIQNEVIDMYNKEIEDIFGNIVEKIVHSENRNVIYTVNYVANIQNDILSVMIYSNFKEGAKAQKVIIKTYNYDLRNEKELKLKEVIGCEQLDEGKIQKMINSKIETEQKRVKEFERNGYNIYNRDINNDMYKLENIQEFYMTDDAIYIIFPYGNNSETSEMDLVIL